MNSNISASDDFREFLESRVVAVKADAELAELFWHHQIDITDENAHNFYDIKLVGDEPRISYTTVTRLKAADRYSWGRLWEPGGHRITVRPARVAQRVTGIKDGRTLDVFTTALAAWLSADDIEVQLVAGREITHRYNGRYHCRCLTYLGDLTNSCMRHGFRKRFGLYEDHALLAIVVCPDCGGTQVRALLWTDIEGKTWLDRVYGPERLVERVQVWAADRGHESCYAGGMGKAIDTRIVVAVPRKDYPEAPYLDSLFHWCRECGTLSNHLDPACREGGHDWVMLHGVEGTNHAGWYGRCPECGSSYEEGQSACHSGNWCARCNEPLCSASRICANGHRSCPACSGVADEHGVCERGCVTCLACESPIRYRDVCIRHGQRCPYCDASLALGADHPALAAPVAIQAIVDRQSLRFVATCPCGQHLEGYRGEERYAVVRCFADEPCQGHCPSCSRRIVLEYAGGQMRGEAEDGRRLFRDYTVSVAPPGRSSAYDWMRLMEPSLPYPYFYPQVFTYPTIPEDAPVLTRAEDVIEPLSEVDDTLSSWVWHDGSTVEATMYFTDDEEGAETDEDDAA